jgi:hypothetical protein
MKTYSPPEPIGGWLTLTAIGLIITPIRYLCVLLSSYLPLFSPRIWNEITSISSPHYHAGLANLIIFEVIGIFINTTIIIILAFFFFKRHKLFPKLIISYNVFSLFISLLDFYFTYTISPLEKHGWQIYELCIQVLICAIWIPYFLVSRRVKATFVFPSKDISYSPTAKRVVRESAIPTDLY